MSYILEALKKSQQERDLGQVPTLETPPPPVEERRTRPNLWILLAVVLAAIAVIIASYSALRGGRAAPEPAALVPSSNQAATTGQASQDEAALMQSLPQPQGPRKSGEQAPVSPSPRRTVGASPVQEPPRPDDLSQAVIKEPLTASEQSESPAPEMPVAAKRETTPEPIQDNKAPPDLIADIEAFKQKIRKEQSDATDTEQGGSKIAPQDLHLPRDVRKRLPEFVLSAHIYDEDPSKRFVLINGLKIQEGEESREEIGVEQILPEGVVLNFDGHRFFQRRR